MHGFDSPNPPSGDNPRQMDTERLKRVFRRAMADIKNGRRDDMVISLCAESERELRRRGFDPEEVASEELA